MVRLNTAVVLNQKEILGTLEEIRRTLAGNRENG